MISHGDGGSNTNASGLPFEKCVLRNHIPGKTYNIGGKDYVYIRQGNFTNHMSDLKDAYWEHDKKPDGAYVSSDRKTVILFECKHQIIPGSVDEKLRTGPCLLEEYRHLYPGVNFHLAFIVNDWWFRQKKYEIPIKFNEKYGIKVFFAKHGDVSWKMHINRKTQKWTLFPAYYTLDESEVNHWMTERSLQS